MKNEIYKEIIVPCDCGCSVFSMKQFLDGDGSVYIEHYIASFYSMQGGVISKLLDRIKAVLTILLGGEYSFYDIVLDDPVQIEHLKEFVSEL